MTTRPPEVICGPGTVARLPEVLAASRVLVVASRRAFHANHLAELLRDNEILLFDRFSPNPSVDDVVRACAAREEWRPDVVVGFGGGSALDVAKCARLLPADPAAVRAGHVRPEEAPQLVLVPTTAGSGSEVTRFATCYDGTTKLSVDDPAMLADVAIVDPDLTASCPPALTGSCAFDAFAHAVESWWSRRATEESRHHARTALDGLVPLLSTGTTDRAVLARSALAAGRAIDLTRTTAAHAFSYRLTAVHGVPHGVACLLNLRWLWQHNLDHDTTGTLGELRTRLGPGDPITGYFARFGWSPWLRDHGVHREDLPALVTAGLTARGRVDHNPFPLDPAEVLERLHRIFQEEP